MIDKFVSIRNMTKFRICSLNTEVILFILDNMAIYLLSNHCMPFLQIEVPQEIKFGDQIYALPPATKNYVPNPNIISGGATPSIMVELGKALLKSAEDGDTNEVKNLIGRGAPMTADWLGMLKRVSKKCTDKCLSSS